MLHRCFHTMEESKFIGTPLYLVNSNMHFAGSSSWGEQTGIRNQEEEDWTTHLCNRLATKLLVIVLYVHDNLYNIAVYFLSVVTRHVITTVLAICGLIDLWVGTYWVQAYSITCTSMQIKGE